MAEAIINGTEVVQNARRKRTCNWCGSTQIKRGVRNPGWTKSRAGDWYCSITHRTVGVDAIKRLGEETDVSRVVASPEPTRRAVSLVETAEPVKRRRHGGRSAEGKVKVTINLTETEREALSSIAEDNCRSLAGHITWVVLQTLEGS